MTVHRTRPQHMVGKLWGNAVLGCVAGMVWVCLCLLQQVACLSTPRSQLAAGTAIAQQHSFADGRCVPCWDPCWSLAMHRLLLYVGVGAWVCTHVTEHNATLPSS